LSSAPATTYRAEAKKNILKPHRRQQWVIPPDASAAFVADMEDVLEVVETRGGPQVDQLCEHVGQVCLGIDARQFARFNERSDTSPIFGPMIMASEECIFSIQNHRPFILPMSVRSWKSITAGIPILAARSSSGA
jgi:hypothetical protein